MSADLNSEFVKGKSKLSRLKHLLFHIPRHGLYRNKVFLQNAVYTVFQYQQFNAEEVEMYAVPITIRHDGFSVGIFISISIEKYTRKN